MIGNFLRILLFSFVGLVLVFGAVFLFSPRVDYQNPERLKILGTEAFDSARWKVSGPEVRGRMVYDLVKRGLYKEGDPRALLGEPTARYLDPKNLAYQVGSLTVKSRFGAGYTFAIVPSSNKGAAFWIEPFPEETQK
jgi:hypothetical protein